MTDEQLLQRIKNLEWAMSQQNVHLPTCVYKRVDNASPVELVYAEPYTCCCWDYDD